MTPAARPQAALAEYLESRFGRGVNQPGRIFPRRMCAASILSRGCQYSSSIADGALQQRSPDAVGVAVATGDLTRADAGSIGKSIETYVKSRDGVRDG